MGRWKDLPSEIVELVIAKLPVVDIFRVQAVNTRMHELVQKMLHDNDSLLYLRSRGKPKSFLSRQLLIPYVTIVALSGTSLMDKPPHVLEHGTKSQNVRLPQLSSYLPSSRRGKIVTMYAGNGGLVLLGLSARHAMIVCNPLTKSWRELPLLPTRLQHAELSKVVMVDKSKRSYKIALFTNSAWGKISKPCYSLVYTPECKEWICKEHNYIDLPNKRFLHICVDDVNSNLAHALVLDLTRPSSKVEIVTFDAEAMIWTPWGYNDILVINHPSRIAKVYTLLVQDGVVYVVVDQTFSISSMTHPNFCYMGTWTTILRLDRHAGKPTAHKLADTHFDNKYYESFERDWAENQPWYMWKSTRRRVISKIYRGEVVEYDLLGSTWNSHNAGAIGPKSYLAQDGYEECWMSV